MHVRRLLSDRILTCYFACRADSINNSGITVKECERHNGQYRSRSWTAVGSKWVSTHMAEVSFPILANPANTKEKIPLLAGKWQEFPLATTVMIPSYFQTDPISAACLFFTWFQAFWFDLPGNFKSLFTKALHSTLVKLRKDWEVNAKI